MLKKITIIIIGIIVAIPILIWFAIRGMFTGGWRLLGFICQHQYRELKQLCEHGTADELASFLATHPGATEYIIYSRHNRTTSIITSLFRLPAPLAVAGKANNLAVIPILLANGASPEIRSVSATESPAEEAIGAPVRMRTLCSGKTWWREYTERSDALAAGIKEGNHRGIIWNTLRGARLTSHKQLYDAKFLHLPVVMKEFVCQFGIDENQREPFLSQLKNLPSTELDRIYSRRPKTPDKLPQNEFSEMMMSMEKAILPLPAVEDDSMTKLMLSTGLLDKKNMLGLLDSLFSLEQQFSILKHFLKAPLTPDNREMTEEIVDLLLCSILAKADD